MTYTPEQLRDQAAEEDAALGYVSMQSDLLRAHADALEELARVKRAIAESCDEQRGEYFGCRRAERAEAALAESERKCERLKFHAKAMVGSIKTYEVREGLNHGGTRRLIECVIADYLSEFRE